MTSTLLRSDAWSEVNETWHKDRSPYVDVQFNIYFFKMAAISKMADILRCNPATTWRISDVMHWSYIGQKLRYLNSTPLTVHICPPMYRVRPGGDIGYCFAMAILVLLLQFLSEPNIEKSNIFHISASIEPKLCILTGIKIFSRQFTLRNSKLPGFGVIAHFPF